MLKVVSDTSPIMSLARAGHLHLLERLYRSVTIPEAVFYELQRCSDLLEDVPLDNLPWLKVTPVSNRVLVDALLVELHRGEAEAIALAVESGADLLLIDERIGEKCWRVALRRDRLKPDGSARASPSSLVVILKRRISVWRYQEMLRLRSA